MLKSFRVSFAAELDLIIVLLIATTVIGLGGYVLRHEPQ